jgi:diamine N-acetyltransferase
MPILLRTATPSDAELLASLGARTFADTFAADNTPEDMAAYLAANFSPAQLAGELAVPTAIFLIAEIDTQTVGYTKLQFGEMPPEITAPRPIELVRIYSVRAHFGKGVGPALMQAALRFATDGAFQNIWLGVWDHNLRAQAFYRKWGFVIVGSHPFLLGSDLQTDYIMQRPV